MTTEFAIFVVVALVILVYVGSLWINPWVKCSRCGGKPQHKGLLFTYSHRFCPKCKGTGQQLRFGRRMIFGRPK